MPRVTALLIVVFALSYGSISIGKEDSNSHNTSPHLQGILNQIRSSTCLAPSESETAEAKQLIKNSSRNIPDETEQLLNAWEKKAKYYKRMYYIFSFSVIIFGALAAAVKDESVWWKKWKTMAALLATIAATVNTTLSLQTEYKKFDDAWVILNTAKLTYKTNPSFTLCDVGKAVAFGESNIHPD